MRSLIEIQGIVTPEADTVHSKPSATSLLVQWGFHPRGDGKDWQPNQLMLKTLSFMDVERNWVVRYLEYLELSFEKFSGEFLRKLKDGECSLPKQNSPPKADEQLSSSADARGIAAISIRIVGKSNLKL